jgi:hypothetical protein
MATSNNIPLIETVESVKITSSNMPGKPTIASSKEITPKKIISVDTLIPTTGSG